MLNQSTTWPHHAEQLGTIPDPEKIEEIGRQIIYRGITNRRLVAFVGAGFSRIYGRPDWKAMVEEIIEKVSQDLASNEDPHSREIRELLTRLGISPQKDGINEKTSGDFFTNVVQLQVLELGFKFLNEQSNKEKLLHKFLAEKFDSNTKSQETSQYKFTKILTSNPSQLPLAILTNTLGIRRFATTNYDGELENALDKLGIPAINGNKVDQSSSLGKGHESLTMVSDSLAKAMAFAIQGRLPRTSILHLHGHYSKPSTMIVTEADYKQHYLRNSPERDLADLVIRALFGANPVLYIGSSVTEDDVLRPLRQFESSEIKRSDCLQVALIPATQSSAELSARAVERYIRYGIHTVHYGWGKNKKTPWLYELTNNAKSFARDFKTDNNARDEARKGISNILHELTSNSNRLVSKWARQAHIHLSSEDTVGVIEEEIEAIRAIQADSITIALLIELDTIAKKQFEWVKTSYIPPIYLPPHSAQDIPAKTHKSKAANNQIRRTFDGFNLPKPEKRRVFVLIGKRGIGKGSIFEEWRSTSLEQVKVIQPFENTTHFRTIEINHLADISSVITKIFSALQEIADDFQVDIQPADVLDRLSSVVNHLTSNQPSNGKRLLVVMGNTSPFFDRRGHPKNGQLRQAMKILFGSRSSNIPVDFIALADEDHLPLTYLQSVQSASGQPTVPATDTRIHSANPNPESRNFYSRLGIDYSGLIARRIFILPIAEPDWHELLKEENIAGNTGDLGSRAAQALGGNRWLFSVVCTLEHLGMGKTPSLKKVRIKSLCRTVDDISLLSQAENSEQSIQYIFDRWETRVTDQSSRRRWNAFILIAWHMSVVAHPMNPESLMICPEIWEFYQEKERSGNPLANPLENIKDDLEFWCRRKLVFSIEKYDGIVYYSVHRLIQVHFFRSMGARKVESVEWDQFTTSLFASQPDESSGFSSKSYQRLSKLMDGLISYPSPSRKPLGSVATSQADALRSAYFLARSCYSMGILHHAGLRDLGSEGQAGIGVLERYRRCIRWITHQAKSLSNVFSPGELVWLYAECGAVNIVQGKLEDAEALIQMALRAVKQIESNIHGPLHIRLHLQLAHIWTERGRPQDARHLLLPIASAREEHEVPPLLAKYHLGWLDHLAGNYRLAEERYKSAQDGLEGLGRFRAVALILVNRADLSVAVSDSDINRAREWLNRAIALAQRGGHEDIRCMAVLAGIRAESKVPNGKVGDDVFEKLRAIEDFSRRMDMPRLELDVHNTRASLLLKQGETRWATHEACASAEAAALYDLKLSKLRAMLTLAKCLERRGRNKLALDMVREGLELAESVEYFTCAKRLRNAQLRLTQYEAGTAT